MRYEVYIDRLFFLHFGMNCLLLVLTDRLGDYRISRRRLLLTAACAAGGYLAVFLCPALGTEGIFARLPAGARAAGAGKILLFFGESLGMLAFAFCQKSGRDLLRAAGLYGAGACLLGGTLSAVLGVCRAFGKEKAGPDTVVSILFLSLAAVLALCSLWKRECCKRENPIWQVRLTEGGKTVEVTALADSGNCLADPCTGRPVCVADREVLEKLGILEKPEKFRVIPYHSVGKKRGLLQAAAVEEMRLYRAGQERVRKKVLIAVSQERLSSLGQWQMLLHPAILEEEKGENHDIESSDAGKDAV